MTSPAEMQQQIDALSAQLADLRAEIAPAIAEGLRVYADRPVGEKGSPSLQFGVVEQVNDTYAYVTLDGQTDAVPINMLGGLVEGERVAVLLVPPSGNLAIGMVTPSTPGVLSVVAGTNVTVDDADPQNPVVASTGSGGSGFPVGPYDDGTGTHEIATVLATGLSELIQSTESDAHPGLLAQVLTGVIANLAGASVTTTSPDGGTASATAQAQEAVRAISSLIATADGGSTGSITVDSLTGGQSTISVIADGASGTIQLDADYLFLVGAVIMTLNGPVLFNQTSAPSTGIFADSLFGFWLDDTPGATVLHIKATDSGGTVRAAAIPLL